VRLLQALQAPVGLGQAVLKEALEAGFGVALEAAAAVFVLDAPLAAAEAVLEQEAGEGEGRGDDGAGGERVDERGISVHE
jgi:hypothetical protein